MAVRQQRGTCALRPLNRGGTQQNADIGREPKCGRRASWAAPGDTSVLLCYHTLALPARASLAAAAQMAHSVNTCWLLEMAPDPA